MCLPFYVLLHLFILAIGNYILENPNLHSAILLARWIHIRIFFYWKLKIYVFQLYKQLILKILFMKNNKLQV